ncbi:MAG: hypothetical protein M1828_002283 [Chrysothrix sp. TS-e1954]|nr:MAG: hypothetical protein M1828_002283 [Chrysothrix sp. TS-e1954]
MPTIHHSPRTVVALPDYTKKHLLSRRQNQSWAKMQGGIIAAVVIIALLFLALLSWIVLRRLRGRYTNPKYVPGKWLKGKWEAWMPSNVRKRYSTSLYDRRSIQEARRSPSPAAVHMLRPMVNDVQTNGSAGITSRGTEVDRRTSVRSIISLPPYSADAGVTEQIIGREGDRGGIDTVLEYPEDDDEEEGRREEEMESLYQIRVARRRERSEREERRRLRREARARRDTAALEELRRQTRAAESTTSLPGELNSVAAIQEHYARERGRRVSSVSYADLGVAMHDGSRVRADSNDSNRPLLSSANPMGNGRPSDPRSRSAPRTHHHNQSTSSLRFAAGDYSDDERASSEFDGGALTPSESRRPSTAGTTQDSASLRLRTTQSTEDEPPPLPNLPSYEDLHRQHRQSIPQEDAPPYESPVDTSRPQLPPLTTLPSIEIIPHTPVVGNDEDGNHAAALRREMN